MTAIGAAQELEKVKDSRKLCASKGKLRGRRHKQRRGPLVVYEPEKDGKDIVLAFRNVPGVETCPVYALNLLQLAPGGHLGRFVIWTSSAFASLDTIYGSTTTSSELKRDFLIPSNVVTQPDSAKLINSSEVQKKNPLKNKQVLLRLNLYAAAYAKERLGHVEAEGGKPEAKDTIFTEALHEN